MMVMRMMRTMMIVMLMVTATEMRTNGTVCSNGVTIRRERVWEWMWMFLALLPVFTCPTCFALQDVCLRCSYEQKCPLLLSCPLLRRCRRCSLRYSSKQGTIQTGFIRLP